MAQYDESGLRLFLNDKAHFRFESLSAYSLLKGQRLKEVDFCWHDTDDNQNRLILLELKEFSRSRDKLGAADLTDKAYRFETLINKVVDSLLILAAAWLGTQKGLPLRGDLPPFAQQRMPLKIIIGLDLPVHMASHYGVLRDKFNARLRGRIALFDIESVAILNYQQLLLKYAQFIQRIP
jgi:hypothetical protein